MPTLDLFSRKIEGETPRPKRATHNAICLVVSGEGRSTSASRPSSGRGTTSSPCRTGPGRATRRAASAELFVVTDRAIYERLDLCGKSWGRRHWRFGASRTSLPDRRGRFIDDLALPGTLHCALVRRRMRMPGSSRIASRLADARRRDGRDMEALDGVGPMRAGWQLPGRWRPPRWALARECAPRRRAGRRGSRREQAATRRTRPSRSGRLRVPDDTWRADLLPVDARRRRAGR